MPYLAGAFMCLIFGTAYIGMKIALETFNPLTVILLRYMLAATILHIIFFAKKNREKIRLEDLKYMILLGTLEPGLYFIFDAYGLKYTTATRASILLAVIPVLTAILAWPVLKEKLTALKVITTVGSIVGIIIVVIAKEPITSGTKYLLGDMFIIFACVAASFYTVLARKLSFKYSFFTITRFQSLMAVIVFLPLALGEWSLIGAQIPNIRSVIAVIYLGGISSVFGYLLLNYTISKLSAANSSILANMIPIVTLILSSIILKEYIGFMKIGGLIIVLGFVFALCWGERKK